MRALLFVVTIAIVAFIVINELRDPPESMMTEKDKIERLLEDYSFNTPKEIAVLHQQEQVDSKTRERVKILMLKTDEEYLPKSPRIPDQAQRVMKALSNILPDYDFGKPTTEEAGYFQWLSPNSEWKVSTLQTSNGHYSLWEKRTDVYQLIN